MSSKGVPSSSVNPRTLAFTELLGTPLLDTGVLRNTHINTQQHGQREYLRTARAENGEILRQGTVAGKSAVADNASVCAGGELFVLFVREWGGWQKRGVGGA